jgi:hypothetical protein
MPKKHRLAPEGCCAPGEYTCQVPMPINGRRCEIDLCVADIVAALNAANIRTVMSCCGHGQADGVVMLEDGLEIRIKKTSQPKGENQ